MTHRIAGRQKSAGSTSDFHGDLRSQAAAAASCLPAAVSRARMCDMTDLATVLGKGCFVTPLERSDVSDLTLTLLTHLACENCQV
jgi:hypothetical protein